MGRRITSLGRRRHQPSTGARYRSGRLLQACKDRRRSDGPSIVFTRIPAADPDGSGSNDIIEGRATGAAPGRKIVLYAKSGKWWVQPLIDQPLTALRANFTWTNATHLGTHYAALLVKDGYSLQKVLDSLPQTGDSVLAVAVAPGAARPPSPIVHFSGYDWPPRALGGCAGAPAVAQPPHPRPTRNM